MLPRKPTTLEDLMENLREREQAWLAEYRRRLEEQFPGLVQDILFYGPYARGVSDIDVDMCVLVLIKQGDHETEKAVSDLGDAVDNDGDFKVAPFVRASTVERWLKEEKMGYSPFGNVSGDGVSAL